MESLLQKCKGMARATLKLEGTMTMLLYGCYSANFFTAVMIIPSTHNAVFCSIANSADNASSTVRQEKSSYSQVMGLHPAKHSPAVSRLTYSFESSLLSILP